jgi:hypothetical protein
VNVLVVISVLVVVGTWAIWTVLRIRRRNHLVANRPQVIEESLKRARAKQRLHRSSDPASKTPRPSDEPDP